MEKRYIGTDRYGRKMYMYHYCGNDVYVDHVKNGKVVKGTYLHVSDNIARMFWSPYTSWAFIYDEIKRIHGVTL